MLNPDGVDASRIRQGSSLSGDAFPNERFHYMIANPPYGKDWNMDKKAVTTEHAEGDRGRFAPVCHVHQMDNADGYAIEDASVLTGGQQGCHRDERFPYSQEMQIAEICNSPIYSKTISRNFSRGS